MSRLTGNELSGLMEAYDSVGKKKKKKVMHDCATHGEHAEWGVGSMIKEMHTLDEEGNITHYDVEFEHGIERNVPVEDLEILVSEAHEHYMNDDKNVEVLDEAPQVVPTAAKLNQQTTTPRKGESVKDAANRADALEYTRRGGFVGQAVRTLTRGFGSNKDIARVDAEDKASQARIRQRVAASQGQYYSSSDGKTYKSYNDAVAAKNSRLNLKPNDKPADKPIPGGGNPAGSSPSGTSPSAAAKPTASGVVLAKQGGVEGKLDKATGKFTAGAFDDKEKARYAQRAPKTGPATGMLGKTSYEVRTPTSAELKAAQAARAGGEKDPEKVLQSAKASGTTEKIFNQKPGPTTGAAAFKPTNPPIKTPQPAAKLDSGVGFGAAKPTAAPTTPAATQMSARAQALKSGGPAGSAREKVLNQSVDAFDLVKGHLLDEGYADSEEGAMVIMVNMSEEWRKSILESYGVELDEAASSRREGESESEFIMRRRTEYMRPRRGPEHETERTSYSPRRARAGEDIGKPGKMFGKIAKEAGERYGSEERGKKVAGAVLAKLRKEEVEQLDEISQKTATRAYAASKTGEFEGADSDRDVKRTDNLKKHIVRKFGKEAGEHAEKAAEAETFGRKDASGKSKGRPKPRIEKSDYRTTQDGKMHKQDQRELKTELRIKRDRRLRKEDLEAWVDELIAEGYDLSGYTWEEVAEIYAQELELSEAQRARENPEGHDKEEKKKYEPVRGERTPMPPRGDKRREDFEKWYAKHVR